MLSKLPDMQHSKLRQTDYVLSTCMGCMPEKDEQRRDVLQYMEFERVLIDEAGQMTEILTLGPQVRGCKQVVLIGDHQQLPPSVSREAAKQGMAISLFERLVESDFDPVILDTQYRFHPSIGEYPSCRYYEARLRPGREASDFALPLGFPWPNEACPVCFVPAAGSEERGPHGRSFQNVDEATMVSSIVGSLMDGDAGELAVLATYAAQVVVLKDVLARQVEQGVVIETIDAFQGREADVVVVSLVRSNTKKRLGFVEDERRMNVALTRGRNGIIVLGDPCTLEDDALAWGDWIRWARKRGLVLEASGLV